MWAGEDFLMIALSYRIHLDHMDLKNWALSLFEKGSPLNTCGLVNYRATPVIQSEKDSWTPDLIAWNRKVLLIIECKSGTPTEEDVVQAKRYLNIPKPLMEKLTGLTDFVQKSMLLYFKEKLNSDPRLKKELLSKLALEKDLVLWVCDRGFQISCESGDHGDAELNSILKGGLSLSHLPRRLIEIQPDSPTILLSKLIFTKLWERSFKFKDTRFTIGTVREILDDHIYSLPKDRDRRLLDAIKIGEKHNLCSTEQEDQIWRLTLMLNSPASIEEFLRKLREMMTYPRLNTFVQE